MAEPALQFDRLTRHSQADDELLNYIQLNRDDALARLDALDVSIRHKLDAQAELIRKIQDDLQALKLLREREGSLVCTTGLHHNTPVG